MGKKDSVSKRKCLNPTDAYRKAEREKEKKRNRRERTKVREESILKKDSADVKEELAALKKKEFLNQLDSSSKKRLQQLESMWKRLQFKFREIEDQRRKETENERRYIESQLNKKKESSSSESTSSDSDDSSSDSSSLTSEDKKVKEVENKKVNRKRRWDVIKKSEIEAGAKEEKLPPEIEERLNILRNNLPTPVSSMHLSQMPPIPPPYFPFINPQTGFPMAHPPHLIFPNQQIPLNDQHPTNLPHTSTNIDPLLPTPSQMLFYPFPSAPQQWSPDMIANQFASPPQVITRMPVQPSRLKDVNIYRSFDQNSTYAVETQKSEVPQPPKEVKAAHSFFVPTQLRVQHRPRPEIRVTTPVPIQVSSLAASARASNKNIIQPSTPSVPEDLEKEFQHFMDEVSQT